MYMLVLASSTAIGESNSLEIPLWALRYNGSRSLWVVAVTIHILNSSVPFDCYVVPLPRTVCCSHRSLSVWLTVPHLIFFRRPHAVSPLRNTSRLLFPPGWSNRLFSKAVCLRA